MLLKHLYCKFKVRRLKYLTLENLLLLNTSFVNCLQYFDPLNFKVCLGKGIKLPKLFMPHKNRHLGKQVTGLFIQVLLHTGMCVFRTLLL